MKYFTQPRDIVFRSRLWVYIIRPIGVLDVDGCWGRVAILRVEFKKNDHVVCCLSAHVASNMFSCLI